MRLSAKHLSLWAAGLITLTGFMSFYFHPVENPYGIGSDTYEYWHLSENLLRHQGFFYSDPELYPLFTLEPLAKRIALPDRIPCTTRMPGYPLLLAAARGLWDSPWITLVLSYLSYTGICLYGFRLSAILFTSALLRWTYNILLVFTPLYFIRWGIGADLPAGLWLTGFTYHILKLSDSESKTTRHTAMALICGVATIFTRVNLLPYTAIMAGAVLLIGLRNGKRRLWQAGLIILLAIGLSLGTWLWRNHRLTDQWTLSTQGGQVLSHIHLADTTVSSRYLTLERKFAFFTEHLRRGKSFNQTEALLDQKLKSAVIHRYQATPLRLGLRWIDRIRTFFMFSYFDISDVIMSIQKPRTERLHLIQSSSSAEQNYTAGQERVRRILFNLSRLYKLAFGFTFLAFPLIFWPLKCRAFIRRSETATALYIATLAAVMMTALYTGAAGDRMKLPLNAPILIFAVWTGSVIIQKFWKWFRPKPQPAG